jgi:dTDP-4-dehydrorhamnose reductase
MLILLIGLTGKLGNVLYKDLKDRHIVLAPTKEVFNILDTNKFEQLINQYNFDIVINTVAYNNLPRCEIELNLAFQYNCFAVENMARICNKYNIIFITFSTNYVFDGKKDNPYIETDIPFPIQIYGLSKLSGEYTSLKYENTIVIRTTGLYGAHKCFINNIINESKEKDFIEISNDQTMSFTYTNDLSKAILRLIIHPKRKYGIYHLVNEGYCTPYELILETFKILNINTKIIPINRGKIDLLHDGNMRRPLFTPLANKNAKEIGIVLPYWKDALKRYLDISDKAKRMQI